MYFYISSKVIAVLRVSLWSLHNVSIRLHCRLIPCHLSWSIMVVVKSSLLIDLYTAISNGTIEVPSPSSCPFSFHEWYREQPFSSHLLIEVLNLG